ncbi:hypothetical protein D9M69_572830 [compost metagenome]
MVGRQAVADAHHDGLAIAGEYHRARGGRVRPVSLEAPDRLQRIGFVESPQRIFPGDQLVGQGHAQLVEALVGRAAGFTGSGVGLFGGDGGEEHRRQRRDLFWQLQGPGNARRAGWEDRAVFLVALALEAYGAGDQWHGQRGCGHFEECSAGFARDPAPVAGCFGRVHGASLPQEWILVIRR